MDMHLVDFGTEWLGMRKASDDFGIVSAPRGSEQHMKSSNIYFREMLDRAVWIKEEE
jgi:hypothetical protein